MRGLSAGAKPAKEAGEPRERPGLGATRVDGPGLPPAREPSVFARGAGASLSAATASSLGGRGGAGVLLTTRVRSGRTAGAKRPSGPVVPLISEGAIRSPPLAMVE